MSSLVDVSNFEEFFVVLAEPITSRFGFIGSAIALHQSIPLGYLLFSGVSICQLLMLRDGL